MLKCAAWCGKAQYDKMVWKWGDVSEEVWEKLSQTTCRLQAYSIGNEKSDKKIRKQFSEFLATVVGMQLFIIVALYIYIYIQQLLTVVYKCSKHDHTKLYLLPLWHLVHSNISLHIMFFSKKQRKAKKALQLVYIFINGVLGCLPFFIILLSCLC